MSETNPNIGDTEKKNEFIAFLEQSPEQLAKFVDIIQEFYKIQRTAPDINKTGEGPTDWKAGETQNITVPAISHEDLDAIAKGYAEAVVKEKCIAYVRGFIAGVMLVV